MTIKETAAIYVRKSKASDKGDSIENQISRCKALCELRDWNYKIYEDYDISGATLNRPAFEQMMQDIYNNKIKFVVCYKLDRVSRSTGDFSNLIEELNSLDVGFISIKENFDLTTPTGRAMMLMTSVFAQLERETIAERVRDNMIDRAKYGRWNGGPVPTGYSRKVINEDNKKVSKLIINPEEAAKVKTIFKYYLEEEGSIRNTVMKLNEKNILTRNNKRWRSNQVSRILKNPLYCINDIEAYNYFTTKRKVNVVDPKSSYNGSSGLMFYNVHKHVLNKDKVKTKVKRPEEDWILSIGEHKGIIKGETFVNAQLKLHANFKKPPRAGQSRTSPLVGLVKCGVCGSSMSIFSSPKNDKEYFNYFRCLVKEQQSKSDCNNSNIRADKLEELIIDNISNILKDKKLIMDILETTNSDIEKNKVPLLSERNKLQSELYNINNQVNNLVDSLSKGILPEKLIKEKFEELKTKEKAIYDKLDEISYKLNVQATHEYDIEQIKENINNFKDNYKYADMSDKKKLMKSIIDEIKITHNKVSLSLLLGQLNDDYQVDCTHKGKDSCWRSS